MAEKKGKLYTEKEVIDILVKDMQRRLLQNDFNVSSVFKVSKYMKENLVFNKCPSRKITKVR